MIEPLLSLALSMHSNPGVYAVLVGSGVSRSAGIPTGWEVVQDLVRKLARLHGEECEPDWEAWFKSKFKQEPTYSGLLDAVAKSQAERSRLLAAYFEPTDDEREQGLKVPTPAHHALARLVRDGHVKVILTTNFDRLTEQALEAAGIAPTVISSPDAIDGAMPLPHSRCTVVKLHGDYLDIRTKNTPLELESYDERTNHLLDHVLDEFGLIVCGWSAEWDIALRMAVERCKGRRFTTYWAVKGKLTTTAKNLVELRGAAVLSIESADQFLPQLAEKLEALAAIDRPHPLSAKVAVAQTKKYLSEPKYKIQLHDLLMQEVNRIVQETTSDRYPVTGNFEPEDVASRVNDFEALSSTAIAVMATGCFWGQPQHHSVWCNAVERLANPPRPQSWRRSMQGLRFYPAHLLLCAGGIAAIAAGNYDTLYALLSKPRVRTSRDQKLMVELSEDFVPETFKQVPGLEKRTLPRSDRVFVVLREPLREFLPNDDLYERAFDRYEAMRSLWGADCEGWAIPGAFMYRYGRFEEGSVLMEIVNEVKAAGQEWPLFRLGFFGGKLERWEAAAQKVMEMTKHFMF